MTKIKLRIKAPFSKCNRDKLGRTKLEYGGNSVWVKTVDWSRAGEEVLASEKKIAECQSFYLVNVINLTKDGDAIIS